jgi:hypothetical protein
MIFALDDFIVEDYASVESVVVGIEQNLSPGSPIIYCRPRDWPARATNVETDKAKAITKGKVAGVTVFPSPMSLWLGHRP